MATTAGERELIAQRIMQLGTGVIAIPNPRGASVDAVLIKEPDYHVPANATDIVCWVEMTGDAANAAYLP
jgi:hypothetical protein